MFIMDVPSVPAQQAPIVLAQATTPTLGNTSQPDFILKDCQETSRIEPQIFNYFSPAAMLGDYLGRSSNRNIAYDPSVLATIKVTLLEGTKHGEISVVNGSYFYEPTPDYLGKDKAIFMAEFEGKHYKIVVELHVLTNVMENMPSSCPPPKLIKVNKPASGNFDYDLNSISVTFADLEGAALGQTTGSTITLDTTAAGYNETNRGQTTIFWRMSRTFQIGQ